MSGELAAQLRRAASRPSRAVNLGSIAQRVRKRRVHRRMAGAASLLAAVLVIGGSVAIAGISGESETTINAGSGSHEPDAFVGPHEPDEGHPGDHWHSLLAVNVCGEWLDPIPEFETRATDANLPAGLHTHGDGFIHIHPFSTEEAGVAATLGRFVDYAGLTLTHDTFTWPTGTANAPDIATWSNGDVCPNADALPGEVRWAVNGATQSGSPADYKLEDGDCIVIAFGPPNLELLTPPSSGTSPINDGIEAPPVNCALPEREVVVRDPGGAVGAAVTNAAELRDRLQAAGFCTDFSAPSVDGTGMLPPADRIMCVTSPTLELAVYASDPDKQADLERHGLICPGDFVEGENWFVLVHETGRGENSIHEEQADAIATALDARVISLQC